MQLLSTRTLLIALAALVAYITYVVTIGAFAQATNASGKFGLLETKWDYPDDGAAPLLEHLETAGRELYRSAQLVDLLFPVLFLTAVTLALVSAVNQRAFPQWLAALTLALAIVGGAFDWTENAFILRLIDAYPDEPAGVASWLALATRVKLALTLTSGSVALVALVMYAVSRFRAAPRTPASGPT